MRECRRCGTADRYKGGKCKVCHRAAVNERRQDRTLEGQCRDCTQYASFESSRCGDCGMKHRRRMRERRKSERSKITYVNDDLIDLTCSP